MKAFEYAGPTSVDAAVKLLGGSDSVEMLSGGTDLISRMKDYVTSPKRVVYLKDIKSLAGIASGGSGGMTVGAGTTLADVLEHKRAEGGVPVALAGDARGGHAADPQHGHGRRQPVPAAAVLVLPLWLRPAGHEGWPEPGSCRRQSLPRDLHDRGQRPVRCSVEPGGPLDCARGHGHAPGPQGERTLKVEELYQVPKKDGDSELAIRDDEVLTRVSIPAPLGTNASYEARQKRAHDWPLVLASVNIETDGGSKVSKARG